MMKNTGWKWVSVLGAVFALHANADTKAKPILDCWDGSFAYTKAKVEEVDEQPDLLTLSIESQDQSFLLPLFKNVGGWGQAKVLIYLQKKDCKFDPKDDFLISCAEGRKSIAHINYSVSFNDRRSVDVLIDAARFTTARHETTTVDGTEKSLSASIELTTQDKRIRTGLGRATATVDLRDRCLNLP